MKKKRRRLSRNDWGLLALFCFLIIYLLNRWVEIQIGKMPSEYNKTYSGKVDFIKDRVFRKKRYFATGDVTRREQMEPNRVFSESWFYKGDEEIASFSSEGERIFDIKGEIPNGKIQFVNQTRKTTGYEWYRDGKRHGRFREYYDNNQLYREAQYYKGKLMIEKLYYYDGTPRMEVDRRDALIAINDTEAGTGRVYYRDGKVMYEWELTNTLNGGHKTSYNQEGDLREIKYYNTMGKIVEVKKF